jgi:hypothetical protein
MNRATVMIFGLALFGAGLLLGMAGSFFRTLPVERPRAVRTIPVAVNTNRPPAQPAAVKQPSGPGSPSAVESELVEALKMLAMALASPPPVAEAATTVTTNEALTNAIPPEVVELVTGEQGPRIDESPLPPPGEVSPGPHAGHWVYDANMGWLWSPASGPPMVLVPMVEVNPGGWVTIRPGARRDREPDKKGPPSSAGSRRSSVIQRDLPGSRRLPAWSPKPRGLKNPSEPASDLPMSSVIQRENSESKRLPAWFPEQRK